MVWENGTPTPLPDLGVEGLSLAWAINDQGQIVGEVLRPDGATDHAVLWQNGMITDLKTLPGDFGSLASGISSDGKVVVGSTWDSSFNWSHAFIYQNGVMTDLNTLLPASSNLYATMGNKINDRGQISGMATVMSGPEKGNIHAFLATPCTPKHGQVGCGRRTYTPEIQCAGECWQSAFAEIRTWSIRAIRGFEAGPPFRPLQRWASHGRKPNGDSQNPHRNVVEQK